MKKVLCLAVLAGILVSCNIAAAQGPAASAEPAPPAKTEPAPAPRSLEVGSAARSVSADPANSVIDESKPSTVAGGVKGRVFAAPTKDSKGGLPVASTVVVKDHRGVEFDRVRTDAAGNYVVNVPPATYTVEVYPDADWLAPATVKVKLTRTEHFKVDFHYKTR